MTRMPESQTRENLPLLCSMRDAEDYQASYETAIRENPANASITPTYKS